MGHLRRHAQVKVPSKLSTTPRFPLWCAAPCRPVTVTTIPTLTPPCLPGHIVVLGSVHGSSSFIEPLREKQARQEDIDALKPIVIVSPEYDAAEVEEYRRL